MQNRRHWIWRRWWLSGALAIAASPVALAQTPPKAQDNAAPPTALSKTSAPLYPESGWLSPSRYTSAYYGFAIDIPHAATVHQLRASVPQKGEHILLALEMVTAGRPTKFVIRALEGKQAEQTAKVDAKERERDDSNWQGARSAKIGPNKAWIVERQGSSYLFSHTYSIFWDLPGATLEAFVESYDEIYDGLLKKAITSAEFFPPSTRNAAEIAGSDAVVYWGPTLPTGFVDQKIAESPGRSINPGIWSGDIYTNQTVGIEFRLPGGWKSQPVTEGARIQAVAMDPELRAESQDRRHELWRVCSRTLVVAEDVDHPIVADIAASIVLVATQQGCMPDLHIPQSVNDRAGSETMASILTRATGMTGLTKGRIAQVGGRHIVELNGTLSYRVPDEILARRLSQRLTVTVHGEYVIELFEVAENPQALRAMEDAVKLLETSRTIPAQNAKGKTVTRPTF